MTKELKKVKCSVYQPFTGTHFVSYFVVSVSREETGDFNLSLIRDTEQEAKDDMRGHLKRLGFEPVYLEGKD